MSSDSDAQSAADWLAQGDAAFDGDDFEKAIPCYSRAIEIDPGNAMAFNRRGYARGMKEDHDGAMTDFKQALALDPQCAPAHRNIGLALCRQGRHDEGIESFTEAIRLSPNDAFAYYNRAVARFKKGELSAARDDLRKARDLDYAINAAFEDALYSAMIDAGDPGVIWLNEGNAAVQAQDAQEAIACYTDAVESDPTLYEAFNSRGNVHAMLGDYDHAIADYDAAIRINPGFAEAYYHRGYARQGKQDYDSAISDCNEAIRLKPGLAPAYYSRAVALFYARDYENAWRDVREAQERGFEADEQFLAALRQASEPPDEPPSHDVEQQQPVEEEQDPGNVCWFCRTNAPDESAALSVELYRDGGRKTRTVDVPRCKFCSAKHDEGWIMGCSIVLGAVLGLGLWAKISSGWGFIVGLVVFGGLTYGGIVLERKLGEKRKEKLRALGLEIKTAPEKRKTKYPEVQRLIGFGWSLNKESSGPATGTAQAASRQAPGAVPGWHLQARDPKNLYSTESPSRCPVCGANTSPLIRAEASNAAVQCRACGAWGCHNCCHYHDERGKPRNKPVARGIMGDAKRYINPQWRHNQCCDCGFKPSWLQKTM